VQNFRIGAAQVMIAAGVAPMRNGGDARDNLGLG
jgi:hypothetical protein